MSCIRLLQGVDMSCRSYARKYFQQIVLVNKQDVVDYLIVTSEDGAPAHRLFFTLKGGSTGYRFTSVAGGFSNLGSFEKTVKEGVPQYLHTIQLLLMGVDEEVKVLLKQLDNSEYFAAIQYHDNTVEVYGFEFGLSTRDYTYDAQAGGGGALILLSSENDALEDDPPYIYGGNIEDFDNNFTTNLPVPEGDFNDDFSDDFYTE